jgi:two-component system response regulator
LNSSPVCILLVEDDPDHAILTIRSLRKAGFEQQIVWVKDGREALDFMNRRAAYADPAVAPRPDLVLLDLNLPKVDGLSVLEEIKGSEGLRTIPVVVLTTSQRQDEVKRAYGAGANSYVTKPVQFADFSEKIRMLGAYWLSTSSLPGN